LANERLFKEGGENLERAIAFYLFALQLLVDSLNPRIIPVRDGAVLADYVWSLEEGILLF
jgi:hypothetical protein